MHFYGFLASLGLLLLTGCNQTAQVATIHWQVQAPTRNSSLSDGTGTSFELADDACYAILVSAESSDLNRMNFKSSGSSCPNRPAHLGKVAGLYKKNDSAELTVSTGEGRRFDLVAFKNTAPAGYDTPPALCAGLLRVDPDASNPGSVVTYVDDKKLNLKPALIATATVSLKEGVNDVVLTALNGNEGLAMSCSESPSNDSGVPSAITIADGNNQSAAVDTVLAPFKVYVADSQGKGVSGAQVDWQRTGSGILAASSTLTDAQGFASVAYTLGIATGSELITATVHNMSLSSQFVATVLSGALAGFDFVGVPAGATAGTAFSFSVRALDVHGNLKRDYVGPANFSSSDSMATLPAIAFTAGDQGQISVSATLTLAGAPTITVENGAAIKTVSVTVSASAAARVIMDTLSSVSAGQNFSATARVTDNFYNNVTSFNNQIVLSIGANPSAGVLAGTKSMSATNGQAVFTGLSINQVGNGYTLHPFVNGLTPSDSNAFNVGSGAATTLAFQVQPSSTTVNTPMSFSVKALDAGGNLTNLSTGTVVIGLDNPNGATLSTTSGSFSAGVAPFNVAINKAGTYTITANSAGLTAATSSSFTIAPMPINFGFSFNSPANFLTSSTQIVIDTQAHLNAMQFVDASSGDFTTDINIHARGTQYDAAQSLVRLGNDGTCNGQITNCEELAADWTPQWNQIVAYWRLNGSGAANVNDTVIDLFGNNGSLQGTVAAAYSTTTAKLRSSLSLNLSNYVEVGKPAALNLAGPKSAFAWVRFNDVSGNPFIIGDLNAGLSQGSLYLTNGSLGYTHGNSGSISITTDFTLKPNIWYHLGYVRSGSDIGIYVNGELAKSSPYSGSPPATYANAGMLNLGASGSAHSGKLNGFLDEVAIWGVALTPDEVQNIYERQASAHGGSRTSRVYNAQSTVDWSSLRWNTRSPAGKALPTVAEQGYSSVTSDLSSGLVGLWHFEEAGFTAQDASPYGNTASSSQTHPGVPGHFGRAIDLSDNNGSITVNYSLALAPTNQVTLSMWFQARSSGVLISKKLGGTSSYTLFLDSNGFARCGINNGTLTYASITHDYRDNVWHHVACVYDLTSIKIVVDGVQQGTQALSGIIAETNENLYFGFDGVSNYLQGRLDEVAIWNRDLTDNELFGLYRRGAERLRFQVRSCSTADCAGELWRGPDGTPNTYFSENLNPTHLPADVSFGNSGLSMSSLQYFQYQEVFGTEDTSTNCNYGSGATFCMPELIKVGVGPDHFDSTAPWIQNNNSVAYTSLSSFTPTATCPGLRFAISYDAATWSYWTGSTWSTSNGTYAQSSLAADISSHLPTYSLPGNFYFRAFLKSDGNSDCQLSGLGVQGFN